MPRLSSLHLGRKNIGRTAIQNPAVRLDGSLDRCPNAFGKFTRVDLDTYRRASFDGQERFRGEVTAEGDVGEMIDVEVAGGRRLEIRVDFPAAGTRRLAGLGRIRLLDPRLEK